MSNTNKANLHKMVINNNKTIQYSSTECIKSKEGTLITEKKIVKKMERIPQRYLKKKNRRNTAIQINIEGQEILKSQMKTPPVILCRNKATRTNGFIARYWWF